MTNPIRLGIFGYPLGHTKSPQMHAAAARDLGIALRYDRFEVHPDDLAAEIQVKHAEGIDGYNLTVPHKEAVLGLLDDVVSAARVIGAVNTVARIGDRYVGHNTDAPGLVRSLEEAGVEVDDLRVVILGAGGAARAAVVGLAEAGAGEIAVLARRPEQSDALVDSLAGATSCTVEAAALSEAQWHFDSADLIVQATSATLESNPRAEEFARMLPIEALPAHAAVVEMVYKPLHTAVLARADDRGLKTIDGLGMLLHQGAIAFELWTGSTPSIEVMRQAVAE